jgi:hypothetical protein
VAEHPFHVVENLFRDGKASQDGRAMDHGRLLSLFGLVDRHRMDLASPFDVRWLYMDCSSG